MQNLKVLIYNLIMAVTSSDADDRQNCIEKYI